MNKSLYIKQRIFALLLIVIFTGIMYYSWHQLLTEGRYSLKAAAFSPLGIVGGIFLLFFPTMIGKPETTKQKIIVLFVFAVGLLLGLYNWYLMDPGAFPFFGKN